MLVCDVCVFALCLCHCTTAHLSEMNEVRAYVCAHTGVHGDEYACEHLLNVCCKCVCVKHVSVEKAGREKERDIVRPMRCRCMQVSYLSGVVGD